MKSWQTAFTALFVIMLFTACASDGLSRRDREAFAKLGEFQPIIASPMNEQSFRAQNIFIEKDENVLSMTAGTVKIEYDLVSGLANIYRTSLGRSAGGELKVISNWLLVCLIIKPPESPAPETDCISQSEFVAHGKGLGYPDIGSV